MRCHSWWVAFVIAVQATVLATAPVRAQSEGMATPAPSGISVETVRAAALEYDGAAGDLAVSMPLVAEPRVSVDGRLEERIWEQAALLRGFTQYDPVEGLEAVQRTEVLVFAGPDALYFGVRAFDDDPDAIRATLGERDRTTRSDDWVRFVIDTFDDQRRAYVFTVNPLGVQHDGLWIEGGGGWGPPIDSNPDFLWASAGRIEPWGYGLELRIPYKSLRFPSEPDQTWGLQVIRRTQRSGYEDSWAPITSDQVNELAQAGRLMGLRDLNPGLFLEINPVTTARRVGGIDAASGNFRRESATGDFGMNVTYGVTSNLTLDATYNPDFSQIEADAGQINVNERFALFLPEKRPFFLEGTEIFDLQKQLVYTRSIANPIAGAKLTGKVGATRVGYLGAVDEGFGGDEAVVNLVRARRDVGVSSTVGLTYTDRTRSGSEYNRVLGGDARLVLARRYTVSILGAASTTGRAEGSEGGYLVAAQVSRSGRGLSFGARFEDSDGGFRAESGFLRRTDEARLDADVRYTFRGARGALIESFRPSLDIGAIWEHDRFWAGQGAAEGDIGLSGTLSFRNNITLSVSGTRRMYAPRTDEYEGLFSGQDSESLAPFRPESDAFDGLYGLRVSLFASNWERVRGRLRAEWRQTPLFDRSRGVPVEQADAWIGDASFTLLPTRSLSAEVGVRHESLLRGDGGERYSSATIPRLRAQYQFSRSFFVRGVAEYATVERGFLLDPATGRPLYSCSADSCVTGSRSATHDVHVEALVSYEPSPGTVFYAGYTRNMRGLEAFRFDELATRNDGLFVKLSYRFRM